MENVLESNLPFSESLFDDHLNNSTFPDWIKGLKIQAWQRFKHLESPSEKQPFWRFSKPQHFFTPPPSSVSENNFQYPLKTAGTLLSQNNQIQATLSNTEVIFCSIEEAIEKHFDLIEPHLFRQKNGLNSEKWEAFHSALSKGGAFLYVPEKLEIQDPFVFHLHSNALECPQIFTLLGENSKAKFIEIYTGNGFVNSTFCASLKENSSLKHSSFQLLSKESKIIKWENIALPCNADFNSFRLNLGAEYARLETQVKLNDSNASIKINSIGLTSNKTTLDQRFSVIHNAPQTHSDILLKNVLMDHSTLIEHCNVNVPKNSQQVSSKQKNQNLVLSPHAVIHTLPELEIEANDVQCSHGATVSHLDDEELFYLMSRGLSQEQSKNLLAQGFCNDIFQKNCLPEECSFWQPFIYQKLAESSCI